MGTPIFYDGFEKSGKFYVRYDLDHDLDLDHLTNFAIKNGGKFSKKTS